MRVVLPLLLATGLAATGCPKKSSTLPEGPPTPTELRPTVVRAWDEVGPALYPEFVELGEWSIVPTVGQLSARHDISLWTRNDTTWGPPEFDVVEFLDTDRRTTDGSAVTAWILGPGPEVREESLLPVPAAGVRRSRRVVGVLLRDFKGAPRASTEPELVGLLGAALPPPWTLCRPSAVEGLAVAYDAVRGLKLGFSSDDSKTEGLWTVDHLEFLRPGFDADAWWTAKGYGECEAFAAVDPQGRVRTIRRAR